MATWKYGPKTVNDDPGGYPPWEDDTYTVEYQTTADCLTVFRNGQVQAGWGYSGSRAVAEMITEWYLSYVLGYDKEMLSKIFNKELK
jgi:hypothetical protein